MNNNNDTKTKIDMTTVRKTMARGTDTVHGTMAKQGLVRPRNDRVVAGVFSVRAITKYTADFQVPGALPLIASAALILAAALIASALPAARAARVDAVQALRSE